MSILLYGCDTTCRHRKENPGLWKQVSEKVAPHLVPRAQDQRICTEHCHFPGGPSRTPSGNSEAAQACLVWSCDPTQHSVQDHPPRHSRRRPPMGSSAEELCLKHKRMDRTWDARPGCHHPKESSVENIVCSCCPSVLPTPKPGKGLMMMMMMKTRLSLVSCYDRFCQQDHQHAWSSAELCSFSSYINNSPELQWHCRQTPCHESLSYYISLFIAWGHADPWRPGCVVKKSPLIKLIFFSIIEQNFTCIQYLWSSWNS